jgi:hypothetical protein
MLREGVKGVGKNFVFSNFWRRAGALLIESRWLLVAGELNDACGG